MGSTAGRALDRRGPTRKQQLLRPSLAERTQYMRSIQDQAGFLPSTGSPSKDLQLLLPPTTILNIRFDSNYLQLSYYTFKLLGGKVYYTILYFHYTILYYTILYYTILYYTILYYTILYYTILYYTILYYTILYYTILYYTILYYTILYYTILYYTILYYTILYYTILYYTILHNRLNQSPRLATLATTQQSAKLLPPFYASLLRLR